MMSLSKSSQKLHRRSRSLCLVVLLATLGVMVAAIKVVEVAQCFVSPSVRAPSRVPFPTTNARDVSAITMAAGKFDGMKVVELKSLLSDKGLPVTGTKPELIARLKAPRRAMAEKAAAEKKKEKAAAAKKKEKAAAQKKEKAAAARKKESVIAKGRRARSQVFRGTKLKTIGGLTKDKLKKNTRGKIVSKAHSAAGKKVYKANGLDKWVAACMKARKALKITGFVPVNGKSDEGKALYEKAKSFYA